MFQGLPLEGHVSCIDTLPDCGHADSKIYYSPILAGIESTFMAAEGRNWLSDPDMALTHMVDGPGDGHFAGLRSIDLRMVWQVLSSIVIVVGNGFGAFILSCNPSKFSSISIPANDSRLHSNSRSRLQKRRLPYLLAPHAGQLRRLPELLRRHADLVLEVAALDDAADDGV